MECSRLGNPALAHSWTRPAARPSSCHRGAAGEACLTPRSCDAAARNCAGWRRSRWSRAPTSPSCLWQPQSERIRLAMARLAMGKSGSSRVKKRDECCA
eukprot:8801936-Alexandrium_andersonii.AAC.1